VLEVLDTAGQEEYTTLRDQWIREGEGFVLIYSITARATFERIERFRDPIVRIKNSETVPIMLVGNKADQERDREVSKEEGEAMAKKLGCKFTETSAKTRMHLEDAYFGVVRDIRKQRDQKLGRVPRKERRRKCTIL